MTDRIDAIRNITTATTVGGTSVIAVDHISTMQFLSQNALAIGVLCTIATSIVAIAASCIGICIKIREHRKNMRGELSHEMEG